MHNIQGLYARSENLTFTNESQIHETLCNVAVSPASGGIYEPSSQIHEPICAN